EVATEVSLNTAFGVERVARYAFARAAQRRKHVTLVHKTNVLSYAGRLGSRVVDEVGKEYPDVEIAYQPTHAPTIPIVTEPGRFAVIDTENRAADINAHLGAGLSARIVLAS